MKALVGGSLALALIIGQGIAPQGPVGTLAGVARDASGGSLPGVTITATKGAESHRTVTNLEGAYRLDALSPGTYRLTAALSGFATTIAVSARVDSGVDNTWNPALEIVGAGMHSTERPRGPDTVPPDIAKPVYALVLDTLPTHGRGRAIVIASTSLLPARLTPDEEPGRTFATLPLELFDMMQTAAGQAPVELQPASIPEPARLIHPRALAMVLAPPDPFRQLDARFGVTHYLSVSQVFVTADRTDAIVFYDYVCGTVCGELVGLWTHRQSPDAPWTVKARRGFAIY